MAQNDTTLHIRGSRRKRGADPLQNALTEAAYKKRAETAPLVLSESQWKETIKEAVYWSGEGYGIPSKYETREQAEAAARRSMMLGYERPDGKSRVHIIETRIRIIEVSLGDG